MSRNDSQSGQLAYKICLATLILLPTFSVGYKLFVSGYSLYDILPRRQYKVSVEMSLDGHDGKSRIRTFAPQSDEYQVIVDTSTVDAAGLQMKLQDAGLNRSAIWSGSSVADDTRVEYTFSVLPTARQYHLAEHLKVADMHPSALTPYLSAEKDIQVDDSEILQTLTSIGADQGFLAERLRKIYDLALALGTRPFKGTTDALTALRLGEASCNGKSRLFVALARATGIPARLVGGLIMNSGTKRTSHQWVEAYVAGHWVPFDPTNGHFAELPERYLVLYRGDESLFRHTSDINFDYQFRISSKMIPSPAAKTNFGAFNLWSLFERLSLPFGLLQTLLMLPMGALVVVLFRNVIGMPTFGTFLPALIAAAAVGTGLIWGTLSVLIVIGAVSIVRWLMQRLELLHSPTLAILLATVVITMMLSSLAAEAAGLNELARVAFLPIAVMAIAAERFYLSLAEKGPGDALKYLIGTLVVVSACYVVMSSLALQILLGGFPETLGYVIAANLYLGRWVGVRLFEYVRFRQLLRAEVV